MGDPYPVDATPLDDMLELVTAERDECKRRAEAAEAERRLLAMLASEIPQFNNPLHVIEAQKIRDRILAANTEPEDTDG